ncbi:hypothetical protein [Yoonia rosea]|uniref:hypothetical protein n=1 Tax=Yoonia rosea TaxID=287098 RepID=UPI00105631A0|nr:hypothetical protein [Yoonia rosea]
MSVSQATHNYAAPSLQEENKWHLRPVRATRDHLYPVLNDEILSERRRHSLVWLHDYCAGDTADNPENHNFVDLHEKH